jgi:hypothetical protein
MKHEPTEKMNTVEYRQQNKSARQLQEEILLMRLAYRQRESANQPRDIRLIGWVSVGIVLGGIIALTILFS